MPEYGKLVDKAGDGVLETVKTVQEANVSAIASVSKAVGEFLPHLPAAPFADKVPTPEELIESGFTFAHKLLDLQKRFVLDVIDALDPIRTKVQGRTNGRATTKA